MPIRLGLPLLVALAVAAQEPLPTLESPEIKRAQESWKRTRDKAREKLSAGFQSALDRLAGQNTATERRLLLFDAVTAEKKRFEQHGFLPWSEPMRPHLAAYLSTVSAEQARLTRDYHALLDRYLRVKNQAALDAIRADLKEVLDVKVIANWSHYSSGREKLISLLSDGKINDRDSTATWALERGMLVLRWPDGKATGGVSVEHCLLAADGLTYEGTNQTGKKISGAYQKPLPRP
jgi:hypothetical protein